MGGGRWGGGFCCGTGSATPGDNDGHQLESHEHSMLVSLLHPAEQASIKKGLLKNATQLLLKHTSLPEDAETQLLAGCGCVFKSMECVEAWWVREVSKRANVKEWTNTVRPFAETEAARLGGVEYIVKAVAVPDVSPLAESMWKVEAPNSDGELNDTNPYHVESVESEDGDEHDEDDESLNSRKSGRDESDESDESDGSDGSDGNDENGENGESDESYKKDKEKEKRSRETTQDSGAEGRPERGGGQLAPAKVSLRDDIEGLGMRLNKKGRR